MTTREYPDATLRRFWAKVNKTDTCWNWTASTVRGYGQFRPGGNDNPTGAHRFSYELGNGPVPAGHQLDHLCRNPLCVRPDHLEVVTYADNQRRGRNARLTWDQVCAIRASDATHTVLAKEYGVSDKMIWSIRNGRKWVSAPTTTSGSRLDDQSRLV